MPNVARAWNYLIGGRDNFEADRKAVRELIAVAPVISDVGPAARSFQRRVVSYLAAQEGIRQFLDVGTGMPTAGNTHEVAQAIAPQARIVYVDNDPVVSAHARALVTSAPEGMARYLEADARDTAQVIAGAAEYLNLAEPTAIILMAVLELLDPLDLARSVVRDLAAAVPPGSFIAIHHLASDLDPSIAAAARVWNSRSPGMRIVPRPRDEVASLAEGLEPVAPGLVPVDQWRPEPPGSDLMLPLYGVVARKPLPAARDRVAGQGQRAQHREGRRRPRAPRAQSGSSRRSAPAW